MRSLKYFFLGLFTILTLSVCAQRQDSIRFSLLTCAPGQEIYALFGHTAIRYENYTQHTDIVFNYGMFSFRTPHFVMRFISGQTDYQLGITPYNYFEAEYAFRGSSVYQQVLNLTQGEKLRLLALLEENYRPENRTYRYNYFYDNCTTRARDRIEEAVEGSVVYPDSIAGLSFRKIVHEFTAGSDWDELGIDLCLGRQADEEIGKRLQMFAPFYMYRYASDAYIIDKNGEKRPLVLHETKIVEAEAEPAEPGFFMSPFLCAACFLFLCVLVGWLQWRNRKIYWGWSVFLNVVQGLAGCIIAFLFFFSVHPTVSSNWLLMLLNPIPLFYIPFMVYFSLKGKRDLYHRVNIVYLTLFMVIVPVCGQKINLSVLPLALGLLVNSVSYVLVWNKRQ